ncbi:MAG TPA: acyltransferase, partial [Casimicrobiaceae bacterium]|nr:acyltransferase [Casimicrobiaceae bacterium]
MPQPSRRPTRSVPDGGIERRCGLHATRVACNLPGPSPVMERPRFPLGYSASLDGARGLMTITVIAAHLDPDWYPGAIIFMDTFFIISGYLITSLLLKDWFELGRIRFARFYLRRIYRLYPALVLMLAAYLIVAALFLRPFEPALRAVGAALFYMMNWARAFDWDISTHLGHAWSLSIEEQF